MEDFRYASQQKSLDESQLAPLQSRQNLSDDNHMYMLHIYVCVSNQSINTDKKELKISEAKTEILFPPVRLLQGKDKAKIDVSISRLTLLRQKQRASTNLKTEISKTLKYGFARIIIKGSEKDYSSIEAAGKRIKKTNY